jgi:hypothetical protein
MAEEFNLGAPAAMVQVVAHKKIKLGRIRIMFRRMAYVLAGVLAAFFALQPSITQAQLATEPIRIIFPFAAGGSGDALARLLA